MKSAIEKILTGAAVRHRLQSWRTVLAAAARCDGAALVNEPGGGQIIVLAPHMDDEVLGCGGTIARHVRAGADVTVIYLTDGRHGSAANAVLPPPERGPRQRQLIEVRKCEARRAAQILGVNEVIFLDAEDQRLQGDTLAAGKLRAILERQPPDLVYLPFFLERHVDHRAANDVLLAAAAGSALEFECRGYEVWTPLFPNCIVQIDDTIDIKTAALACYESQLMDMDYLHFGVGLSAYRASGIGPAARYAEAFHRLTLTDYRRFHRAVCRFP
jgi:LmbE family N-acetylglucosaminyl deacetylase